GEAATEAGQFLERLAPMLDDRDLLLVDQRGTGQSGALRCHFFSPDNPAESLQNLFPPARVESCAKDLATHADLTQYSYQRFADDLEKIRRTLGYGPLTLFAGSYGTRAAQVFVRAYPSSVRTIYLGSVDPIDIANPLPFAKAAHGTPPWFTEHATPGFQNRVEVIMFNRGHTEWAPCVETLYQRFLNQRSAQGLDASACSHLSR